MKKLKEENVLGYEKIGKLIRKFSIPCIISLLVNSLYNVVDQIFIGWDVGYLGNGATNVVFPITIIGVAISTMLGDGAANFFSLKLGEKKKDEASKGVGNGIGLCTLLTIIITTISLLFLPQLLNIFGCTDALREYATRYGYIIAMGLPFVMIGITLNSIIRADGSPKYAMISMVTGAVLNIILDPIFIFVFKLNIAGAGIATVISQIVTFIINIAYIKKFKNIQLTKEHIKIKFQITKRILALGMSSFIMQISYVLIMAIQNNLLSEYGKCTKFGAEIPITVLGIVLKVAQILNSIVTGVATGTQPIIAYNYGSVKYDRVKKTIKMIIYINLIISAISTVIFETMPDKLISIFGEGDSNYIEFACLAFRIYLMLYICGAIQITASAILQAMGKSVKSIILSLSKQIIILIPAMLILGHIFGLMGMLYAGAVSDGLSFLVSVILLMIEIKAINESKLSSQTLIDDTSTDNKLNKHIVITISREYGSGGRYVGRLIADKLGIKLYDKDLVLKVAEETGLTQEYIESNEETRNALSNLNNGYYAGLSNSDELFIKESEIIKDLAQKESCVIIGRCADFVLKDWQNVIKVFIHSNMKDKIKRTTQYYGINQENAEKEIKRIDKLRGNHYKHYTEKEWKDFANYDICINSDLLGVEKSADIICNMIKESVLE